MTLNNTVTLQSWQARSQKCEMGGGANGESGGAAGRAPKARESRRFGEKVSPSSMGKGSGNGACPLPRIFLNFLSRYAAFWVQSNAFSDITRPVPNSQHSQPAESSAIIKPAVPHWVRDAGHIKGFFTGALEQVHDFKFLGSYKSADGDCTKEIKRRIALAI